MRVEKYTKVDSKRTMTFKIFLKKVEISSLDPNYILFDCIMEKYPNIIELILELVESNKRLEKKVDLLLRRTGKVDLFDEFNIEGLDKAAAKLGMSVKTLTKKIHMEGSKLKKEKHYRISDTGFYTFSEAALLSVKGLI